jgi:hypothetical protein
MKGRRLAGLGVLLVTGAALAGCGPGGSGASDSAAASSALARLSHAAAALTSPADTAPKGVPTGQIRVVNLYSENGQPGGPIDLYDVLHPTGKDTPIIQDLAYGQVSPYVSPRAGDRGFPSQLWIFPAGSLQPSGAYTGSNVSNAGWMADEKLTVVLGPTTLTGSFGSKELSDGQSKEEPLPSQSASPGQATLSTWDADFALSDAPHAYLTVDGACPSALDQSAGAPGMIGGVFAVPAGTHRVGVLSVPPGTGLTSQQCSAQAGAATDTVTVDAPAGGRVDVIAYGSSAGAMKLVVAPVS